MTLRTNGNRLWTNLMEMAKIGATPKNGSSRLALSPVDSLGRQKFIADCEAIGMTWTTDKIGNMFFRYEGGAASATPSSLPPVVMGSHLDTQPLGGRFDGVYGVLAALEVVRTIHENKIKTEKPIEIAVWTNEEGTRFSPSCMGSAVFSGSMALEDALNTKDSAGVSVKDSLKSEGWAGPSPFGRKFDSYFEAHIEQGPVLEAANIPIGVVTGGQAYKWLDAYIGGKAAHAGSTPMSVRKDALLAMSDFALRVERQTKTKKDAKFTIGEMTINSPSRNVIPSDIGFSLDFRYPDDAVLEELVQDARDIMAEVCEERGVQGRIVDHFHSPFAPFDDHLMGLVEGAANALDYPSMKLVSGAGHDACQMAMYHCPTVMIFIPCLDGISHNESESIEPEHAEMGANVLLGAVLQQAGV